MTEHELGQLLTIDELAELARESRRTIQRRIAAGELAVVHLSRRAVRIPAAEAARYLHALAQPAAAADMLDGNVHPLNGGTA